MTENLLCQFLNEKHYDLRGANNGCWIDQKCAPDEIRFVAECIIEYLKETGKSIFQSPDVWHSGFARQQVQVYFGKPDPFSKEALDEYNKFFRQPMKMFAAAGVLKENGKKNNTIQFSVENKDVLDFVSRNDWNSYLFLTHYVEKVLRDSGIWDPFASFFDEQTQERFLELRSAFIDFELHNTPKNGDVEVRRILPKVLNPLACRFGKKGVIQGRMSPMKITFPMMIYNRENWRDTDKAKDVPRRGNCDISPVQLGNSFQYLVSKAKTEVRKYNDDYNGGKSEVLGLHHAGHAMHVHHMFMSAEFPVIADFPENLIALTPGQHLGLAHPDGNTSVVAKEYQYQCLLSKSETIEKNIVGACGPEGFYEFEKFRFVLSTGLGSEAFENVPMNDFTELRNQIDARCG